MVALYGESRHTGNMPVGLIGAEQAIDRHRVGSRAIIDRQTIHVHDLAVEVKTEFPGDRHIQQIGGTRSALAAPLLREGVPIGRLLSAERRPVLSPKSRSNSSKPLQPRP